MGLQERIGGGERQAAGSGRGRRAVRNQRREQCETSWNKQDHPEVPTGTQENKCKLGGSAIPAQMLSVPKWNPNWGAGEQIEKKELNGSI